MMVRPHVFGARLHIAGYEFFCRDSGGGLTLVSHHPRTSSYWLWSVSVQRSRNRPGWAPRREGQWHDWYWLPFGFRLVVSQQDWDKRTRR